jgi:hypothetical protein
MKVKASRIPVIWKNRTHPESEGESKERTTKKSAPKKKQKGDLDPKRTTPPRQEPEGHSQKAKIPMAKWGPKSRNQKNHQ